MKRKNTHTRAVSGFAGAWISYFPLKPRNVGNNYVTFVPVEAAVPWRVNCIHQVTHHQGMKCVFPLLHLLPSPLAREQLGLPCSVLSLFDGRKQVYKRFVRRSGIAKFLPLGV